jgi:plastocyanin
MKTKISLIFVALLLLAACGPKAGSTPAGTLPPIQSTATQPSAINTSAPTASGTTEVTIQGFAFSPAALTIKVGTTVKWTNQDSAGHTVTADDNSWGSGNLAQGSSYTFTFANAGTYAYHCGVHPSMKATITVVAP